MTSTAMASLARDGYLVLQGLFAAGEVESLRAAADRVVESPWGTSCARPNNTLVPLRWNDPIVAHVVGDPGRMARLGEAVGARDPRWISGYVSVKDPHSLPLWWHQDWWCWNHPVTYRREPVQLALLCYLTDTDTRHGALRVLPGSHARSAPVHAALPEAHRDPSTALDPRHKAMSDLPDQVTLALRAGDAVVLDYRLLHGTHANASPRRRDCLLMSFAPCWGEVPSDIRSHLISHPALPTSDEAPPSTGWAARLLPTYDGPRRDLELNRNAPAEFALSGI